MLNACLVTLSRSFRAPVETFPNITFSEALPPSVAVISSNIWSQFVICRSSGRYQAAPRAFPRGTMVTFTSGCACSSSQLMEACPASWKAITFFSLAEMILLRFSSPPIILSMASIKSCFSTLLWPFLAAIKAASLQTLAISAPEKPGVCFARNSTLVDSSIFKGLICTLKIAFLSSRSGSSTWICLSNLPARIRARSRISARLVAARMITPVLLEKPSISVSNWFKVFSLSSLAPVKAFFPLALPMASISSIKMIQGAFSFACLNRSRTLEAPTPTNISTKSDPEMLKKGTLASPATALASNVLPVPGGPTSSAPFGILPPSLVYFSGLFRKSTISLISTLASSSPATS